MQSAEVYRFRRALDRAPEAPRWPAGFRIVPFEPWRHARLVHRMLEEGYGDGAGRVAEFAAWWSALIADAEYEPDLLFVVADRTGAPAAAAICWTGAFVKDLVVAAAARRQGLGSNLLHHIFHTFRTRGAGAVELKVVAGNGAAISLYRSVGMTCVEMLRTPP